MTFAEYIGFYGLARSEGLVLRYLADAYKAMRQTVPEEARTEELDDLIEWLGELVRQVDSSLLDEWERLRNPVEEAAHLAADRPPAVTGNKRAFRVLVRNALFRRVELAALRRWDGARRRSTRRPAGTPTPGRTRCRRTSTSTTSIGTGADARGPGLLILDEQPGRWAARQIFDDPAGDHDWGFSADGRPGRLRRGRGRSDHGDEYRTALTCSVSHLGLARPPQMQCLGCISVIDLQPSGSR